MREVRHRSPPPVLCCQPFGGCIPGASRRPVCEAARLSDGDCEARPVDSMIGVMGSITSDHRLTEATWQALAASPVMAAIEDGQQRIIRANAGFDAVFLHGLPLPVSFADMIRHGFANGFGVHITSGDVEAFLSRVVPVRQQMPYRAFASDLVGGRWIWMTETLQVDGTMLLLAADVTALKTGELAQVRAHELALTASLTDDLTGLANRRHILAMAREHLDAGDHQPFSLAIIDLDNFKIINDSLGHERGDAVLKHFADRCRAALAANDAVGRYGGEDFLLLFPGSDAARAEAAVDRIRRLGGSCGSVCYSFSAGVAQGQIGESLDSQITRADRALYAAKRAGKCCTRIA